MLPSLLYTLLYDTAAVSSYTPLPVDCRLGRARPLPEIGRSKEIVMKRQWTNDDLVAQWTLQPSELALVAYKEGTNRLGFALLLKYFQIDGRFPRQKHDVPVAAIAFVAHQLDVSIDLYPAYDWDGRTIKQHRADIRAFLDVRESTIQDYDEMIAHLIANDVPNDHQLEHLKAIVYARFRVLQIEPPTPDRVERLVRSALRTYEQQFCAAIHASSPQKR
jgi:hypothetical protein